MPRGSNESAPEDAEGPSSAPRRARTTVSRPYHPSPALIQALRPWVDVEEVGAVGLEAFLLSVLPLLPRPSGHDRRPGRTSDERVVELARALAGCASDRARVHFQASQYFQENRVLVRRLKALEGMLRTRELSRGAQISLADEETETAMHRYLPRRGGG